MSSFAGIVALNGQPVAHHEVACMIARLPQVGQPEIWADGGPAGLGYGRGTARAVRALPEHPRVGHGSHVLVADCRLDNTADLQRTLGLPAETATDASLLRAAYARWGPACTDHLLGAFAFALWDARQRTLFCARDHLGLRPLYYTRSTTHLAVASAAGALLAAPRVPRRIHEGQVADYLMEVHTDERATFFKEVYRLPAAHRLLATPDGVSIARYWAPDPGKQVRLSSDAAYEEAFEAHFSEAVRCRLRGTQRAGTLLSGGLDSSAITTVAHALLGATDDAPLDTFSLIYDEVSSCDERPYIEAVLARGGFRPHYVYGDRYHALEDLDRQLDGLEAPFLTPNLFLSAKLFEQARTVGVDTVLDGFLGDNVVGHGSRYLTELAARGRWLQLAREISSISKHRGRSRRRASREILHQFVWTPLVAAPVQRRWHRFTGPPLPALSRFIDPACLHHDRWLEQAAAAGALAAYPRRTVRQEDHDALTDPLLPRAAEALYRAASMHGVDVRLPFADHRLVTFCLALPATQKYRRGWTRSITRRGLRGYLPDEIRTRYGKANLSPNFRHGLRVLGRDAMRSLLLDRLPVAAPYVNVPAVQQLCRQYLSDEAAHNPYATFLWRVAVLVRWLEREREGLSVPAPAAPASEPVLL